jgi:hypothetical protein
MPTLEHIRNLCAEQQFDAALAETELLLSQNQCSPYLWVLKGDLIQLSEHGSLNDVVASYKTALDLNSADLDALASLAHFYDAVQSNAESARRYATKYISLAEKGLLEMQKIEANDTIATEWFSALLVFQVVSKTDSNWKRTMESLVVFRARDFESAKIKALEIANQKSVTEGVRYHNGEEIISLVFSHIKNLDIVGSEIENKEVWAKLSDNEIIANDTEPSQTI